MTDWTLMLFVIASGFTAAGLLSAIHRAVSGSDAEMRLSVASPLAVFWSILLCAFAGPYIAVSHAWPYWRQGDLPHHRMALVAAISGIWSFCSGVFVVQFCALIGLSA